MLRLHFAQLLHVGGGLGLLFEDELHSSSHFLVGHDRSQVAITI
jgi:hypothetical protein